MRTAICSGSFDPITLGHLNIIERAAKIFDKVYVCAMVNGEKKNRLFTDEERLAMLRASTEKLENVEAELWSGLLSAYAKEKGAHFLVKGVRNGTDFDAEHAMADINRSLDEELETVLLCADARLSFFSSTMAREMIKYKQDLTKYLPTAAVEFIERKEWV